MNSWTKPVKKACVYYYAEVNSLTKSKNATDHEKAYYNLVAIDKLIPGFRDVPELLEGFNQAKLQNISYYVKFDNPNYMPVELISEFENFSPDFMNTPKYSFFKKREQGLNYKYHIDIMVTDVKISPENTQEIEYTETAEQQDGVAYKMDEEGEFIRDTLGNKIEILKFKSLACYVTESVQKKSMQIGGTVIVYDLKTKKEITRQSVIGETKFYHRSTAFKGDLDALCAETYELVGTKVLDYPDDVEMMLRASDIFKVNVMNYIVKELDELEINVTKNE